LGQAAQAAQIPPTAQTAQAEAVEVLRLSAPLSRLAVGPVAAAAQIPLEARRPELAAPMFVYFTQPTPRELAAAQELQAET
jgi:hypothetical protein